MLGAVIGGLAGLAGSMFGASKQEQAMDKQLDMQKDAMQNGISWKVADANRAGIHPLFAMGSQPFNFSPVQLPDYSGVSSSLAQMGQDISSSVFRGSGSATRSAVTKIATELAVERGGLENELLRTQIRRLRTEVPPGLPPTPKSDLPSNVSVDSGVSNHPKYAGVMYEPIASPDGRTEYIQVMNPGLGARFEDHYSDLGGNIVASPALADDLTRKGANYFGDVASGIDWYGAYRSRYKNRRGWWSDWTN